VCWQGITLVTAVYLHWANNVQLKEREQEGVRWVFMLVSKVACMGGGLACMGGLRLALTNQRFLFYSWRKSLGQGSAAAGKAACPFCCCCWWW